MIVIPIGIVAYQKSEKVRSERVKGHEERETETQNEHREP